MYAKPYKFKVLKASLKGFCNIDEISINENIKKLFIIKFLFYLYTDINKNYYKINAIHNLLNNRKLTLREINKFKTLLKNILFK